MIKVIILILVLLLVVGCNYDCKDDCLESKGCSYNRGRLNCPEGNDTGQIKTECNALCNTGNYIKNP